MAASDTQIRARDLRVGDPALRARLIGVFERVLDHGIFIGGPELETFERQFADFCGVRHAVGCASGTSALYLALRGLGLGPGDEVITTPLSWIATLNAINAVSATAAFADIGPDLNIDPTTIEAKITTRTRAILPVHFTGRMCDMDSITEIAQRNNLLVIEDAAQSAGARYRGRPAGSFSDAAAFSFNPMKVFGALGEAGMVTTPDTAVRARIESFRYLGTVNRETCVARELNHKMDALQAAFLGALLPDLETHVATRAHLAGLYGDLLGDVVICPLAEDDRRSVFFDYTVLAEDRDRLLLHLQACGIEARIKHAPLMCDQPAYADLPPAACPNARDLVDRIITLPLHEKMSDADVHYVADAVQQHYGRTGA